MMEIPSRKKALEDVNQRVSSPQVSLYTLVNALMVYSGLRKVNYKIIIQNDSWLRFYLEGTHWYGTSRYWV